MGTLVAVIIPLLGLAVAIYLAWGWGITWVDVGLLLGMYILSGLGITLGFHRLFTHRSFETVPPIKIALAICGSMAVEGSLLRWVANHRRHHRHSDQEQDPHSPHQSGRGLRGLLVGWWHAHIGWIFLAGTPNYDRFVPDLQRDRGLRWVSRLFGVWILLGLLLPAAIGGAITGTWTGALLGFLWGGLVRVFMVHHLTWSINSVCHIWGSQPFRSRDHSRNNWLFGILAFGEGWHNNHHAFPASARHGLHWWQLDISYLIIKGLERLGLAWDVRTPAPAQVAARRLPRQKAE